MPKHGEKRNRGTEVVNGKNVQFLTPDGHVAYEGPCSTTTTSTYESWCEKCQEWKRISSFLNIIVDALECTACGKRK